MALSSHATGVAKVAIGSTEIAKISVGSALIWSAVTYGGVGVGATGTSVPAPFNLTVPNGGDVFIVATTDRSAATVTGASFGGSAATEIASVAHNADALRGTTKVYRLAGGGDGTSKAVAITGGGAGVWAVNAFYWTGVTSVGTPITATGFNTAPSQSLSGRGMHIHGRGNGGGGVGTIGSFSGVTNRVAIADSAVAVGQALSTVDAAGTFAATLSISSRWAGVFIPID